MRKWCLVAGVPVCVLLVVLAYLHAYAWYCVAQAEPSSCTPDAVARRYGCLSCARSCEPDNPATYYLMGKMYEEIRGKPQLAEKLTGLPKRQADLKRRALSLAIRCLKDASDLDPRNALYHWSLGVAYLDVPVAEDESAHEKASVELGRAVDLDRSNPLYHLWVGIYYHASGLLTGAVGKYREAIACDQSYAPRVLKAAWDIDHYPPCLYKIAQGDERLETMLPGFLMERNALAAARAACIAACQKADDFALANQVELLRRLILLRQPALAELYALEWLQRRPSVPLQAMLVSALELNGEHELAAKKMEELGESEAASAAYHARLADLYRGADRPDDAIREYEEAIKLEPKNADHFDALARFHWDRKDFAAATRAYERLAEALPDNAFARYQVGNAYMASNDVEHAIAAFREAVRLAPDDGQFKRALADACAQRAEPAKPKEKKPEAPPAP